MRTHRNTHTSGFTIIEVLVSVALFGILIMLILSPMLNSFGMLTASKTNLQGSSDAARDLEKARQITLSNYSNSSNLTTALNNLGLGNQLTCNNINTFGTVIGSCSASNNPPLRQLTLTKNVNNSNLVLKVSVRP